MIGWVVAAGVAAKLAQLHRNGKRKMSKRSIHSRKSMDLPRSLAGIPRAFGRRAMNEVKRKGGESRELHFEEKSGRICIRRDHVNDTACARCHDGGKALDKKGYDYGSNRR